MKTFYIILHLLITFNLSATIQDPDLLLIEGDTVYLKSFPLEELELQYQPFGLTRSTAPSSACWRGYQAIWRLQNDSLFLEKILECSLGYESFAIGGNAGEPIRKSQPPKEENLQELFRKNGLKGKMKDNRVFADWYNGVLVVPSEVGTWHSIGREFKRTLYDSSLRIQI